MAFRIHLFLVYTTLCLLSLYHADAFSALERPKAESPILGFSWQNCGSVSDPLQIKSLDVSPDTIKIPGIMTLSTTVEITSALPTDITMSLTMEKYLGFFYMPIPCIGGFGSCTYPTVCNDWAESCPIYFEKYGIPCNCPIPANTYTISDAVMDITMTLPAIASGDFRIVADLDSSSGHLGCIKLEFTLRQG